MSNFIRNFTVVSFGWLFAQICYAADLPNQGVVAQQNVIKREANVVQRVTVQETFTAVANVGTAFIDVRELDEVAAIAAKGALVFPMSTLDPSEFESHSGIKKAQHLYVLCRSGARSMKVATALAATGYEHVYNVEGGILAWEQAGLPVIIGK